MSRIDKVLYTGKTRTFGGRSGVSRSSDGRLDVKLSPPGAGWSACFAGAMGLAARKRRIALPDDLSVDAEVDLGIAGEAYFLQARLNVSLPGVRRDIAQLLVDEAHQNCPYSKLTRGNIDVVVNLT